MLTACCVWLDKSAVPPGKLPEGRVAGEPDGFVNGFENRCIRICNLPQTITRDSVSGGCATHSCVAILLPVRAGRMQPQGCLPCQTGLARRISGLRQAGIPEHERRPRHPPAYQIQDVHPAGYADLRGRCRGVGCRTSIQFCEKVCPAKQAKTVSGARKTQQA